METKVIIISFTYVAFCFLVGCFFRGSCYGDGYEVPKPEPEDFELVNIEYDENQFHTEGLVDV